MNKQFLVAAALAAFTTLLALRLTAGFQLSPMQDLFLLAGWSGSALALLCQFCNESFDKSEG